MSTSVDSTDIRPHSVYRCYAGDGSLLYVGCAIDVESRMFHHLHMCNMGKQPNDTLRRHMVRWDEVRYPTKGEARLAERAAIAGEAPLINKQHNPKRFRKYGPKRVYGFVGEPHPIQAEAFPELVSIPEAGAA